MWLTSNMSGKYHFWGEAEGVNVSPWSAKSVGLMPPPVMRHPKYGRHRLDKQAGGGGRGGSSRERQDWMLASEKCQIHYQLENLGGTQSGGTKERNVNSLICETTNGQAMAPLRATFQQKFSKTLSLFQADAILGGKWQSVKESCSWKRFLLFYFDHVEESMLGGKNTDVRI